MLFRKATQSRVTCENGENAIWNFLGAILNGVVSLYQTGRQVISEAEVLFCRPFR